MQRKSSNPEVVPISVYNSDDGKRWYAYVIGRSEITGRGKSPVEAIRKLEKQARTRFGVPIELKVKVENIVFPDLMTLQEYDEWARTRELRS